MVCKLRRSLALGFMLALGACGSIEMSLEDSPGSDPSVVLQRDATVYVAKPTLSKAAAAMLDDERHPRAKYTSQVRRSMVSALERRGVAATTSDAGVGSTLRIRITDFGRGGGTAGFFFRGGIEYSSIDGSAVLETPQGKRELRIEQAGAEQDATEADDRTSGNIEAFTAAIAEHITG